MTQNKAPLMTVDQIKEVLPHRYPFLLVDRIFEMREDFISGVKNVTANEPFFQGHFPSRPVMPGVLIVEALAQLGAVFMLSKPANKGKLAFLVAINHARFRKVVVPGDQLMMEMTMVKMKLKLGVVKGVAKVNGEEACEAEIMFTIVD